MVSTGHCNPCGNRSGGVRSISLARASSIVQVTFDDASRSVAALTLREGEALVEVPFMEDSASFAEQASWEKGALLVVHELRFSADPVDAATARAVERLAEGSRTGGLIALVRTQAGECFLVGYSRRFGMEQALRLAESKAATGVRKADKPLRTFVLRSADDAPALPFTGI